MKQWQRPQIFSIGVDKTESSFGFRGSDNFLSASSIGQQIESLLDANGFPIGEVANGPVS